MNFLNEPFGRYYSQHGEDYLLWKFFDFKKNGYFIEIGAFDGKYLSNTLSFEENGWGGICIEPIPEMYALCSKNRKKSKCINAAVGSDEKNHQKVNFFQDEMGLYASCATSDKNAEFIEQCYANDNIEFKGLKEYQVVMRSMNDVLQEEKIQEKEIDFISIDVEGFELDVLTGFNLKKYKPAVVLIEANDEDQKMKILEYMEKEDYILAREISVNLLFVNNQSDVEKLRKIQINCMLEKQLHPKGIEYSIKARNVGVAIWKNKYIFPSTNEYIHDIADKYQKELQKANLIINEKEQHIRKQSANAQDMQKKISELQEEKVQANLIINEKEQHIEFLLNSLKQLVTNTSNFTNKE